MMPGTVKTYMFHVPPDSPVKYGPPSFRPTIRVEGKYVAFSSSADSARAALEAVRKKGWKPSSEVEQALAHLPSPLSLLMLSDPRETLPTVLASLPGTLQGQINTMIALSAPGAAGNQPAGGQRPGGHGGRWGARGIPGGMSQMMARRGMRGGGAGAGRAAAGGGPPAGRRRDMAAAGSRARTYGLPRPGTGAGRLGLGRRLDDRAQGRPPKLPKAEDLKALLFPATLAIATDDQSVRIVTREAFPSWVGSNGGMGSSSVALASVLAMVRGSLGIKHHGRRGAARGREHRAPARPVHRGRHSPPRADSSSRTRRPAMKGRGGRRGVRPGAEPD